MSDMSENTTPTEQMTEPSAEETACAQAEAALQHLECPVSHKPAKFSVEAREGKEGLIVAETYSSAHRQIVQQTARTKGIKLRVVQADNNRIDAKKGKAKDKAGRKRRSLKKVR